ncbi:hypothetical protein [Sorangium sp. So ce124]|uniref:hypothetical protein n=1 Tax=Sorangium sp. So ce124 TaxID=3133280 RepID=UPI003F62D96F
MTLRDLTDELRNAERSWARGGRRFLEQFSSAAQQTQVGLYVLVHENASEHAIYDRNGDGRLLINPNAIGVKYGKFQNGFLSRRFTDHKHLHRRRPDGSEEVDVFASVLRYALVLDLSEIDLGPANAAEVFEPYWNAMLESVLARKGWLTIGQSWQSESRHVEPGVAWESVRNELDARAPSLAQRIRDAAAVLARTE